MRKVINKKIKNWTRRFVALSGFYARSKKNYFIRQAKTHNKQIQEIISDNCYDEIILYAHSAGVIPLMYLLDELNEEFFKRIKIITAGQCLSSYINISHFTKFKKRIIALTKSNNLNWTDIYSPIDGVSSNLDSDQEFKAVGLSSQNAQFHKMYSDKRYSEVKKDLFLLHFHYILCGDNPVNRLNFYHLLTNDKSINSYK